MAGVVLALMVSACGGGGGSTATSGGDTAPVTTPAPATTPVSAPVPAPATSGVTYISRLAVTGATAAVGLLNQQGANGYAYIGPYASSYAVAGAGLQSYTIEELFVKGPGSTTYQYKAVAVPVTPAGCLTLLNAEGANGYLYKGSQLSSALFVKSSARNTTYSYRLIPGFTTLAALNTNGADGYGSRGNYICGGVHSLYVKDNSSSATFSYVTKPNSTTASTLLAEMNAMGALKYVYTGTYLLSDGTVAIYEKNSTNTVTTEYTNDAASPSSTSSQTLIGKASQFAAAGFYYFGDLVVGGSFFYKGASVFNPLTGPVFP